MTYDFRQTMHTAPLSCKQFRALRHGHPSMLRGLRKHPLVALFLALCLNLDAGFLSVSGSEYTGKKGGESFKRPGDSATRSLPPPNAVNPQHSQNCPKIMRQNAPIQQNSPALSNYAPIHGTIPREVYNKVVGDGTLLNQGSSASSQGDRFSSPPASMNQAASARLKEKVTDRSECASINASSVHSPGIALISGSGERVNAGDADAFSGGHGDASLSEMNDGSAGNHRKLRGMSATNTNSPPIENRVPSSKRTTTLEDLKKVISHNSSLQDNSSNVRADKSRSGSRELQDWYREGSPIDTTTGESASLTVQEWGLRYRVSHKANPYDPKAFCQYYAYPRCERTDAAFKASLDHFRADLRVFEEQSLPDDMFRDHIPELEPDPTDQQPILNLDPATGRVLGVNLNARTVSRPERIYSKPREMHWIANPCHLLGQSFEVLNALERYDGDTARKNSIFLIKDRNSGKKYVRKTYFKLPFFGAESAVLQALHHPYFAVPVCVDYGNGQLFNSDTAPTMDNFHNTLGHISILFEHFEGERLTDAAYEIGITCAKKLLETEADADKSRDFYSTPFWIDLGNRVFALLAKVMTALKYMHERGIIHNDVKPENILVSRDYKVIKMIDFDSSSFLPFVYNLRGTSTTIAPEQVGLLAGPVHYGVDSWAFGSTAAMTFAAAYAGAVSKLDRTAQPEFIERLRDYAPFVYDIKTGKYQMNPLPKQIPAIFRAFLYPFFNPNPAFRAFHADYAFDWLRNWTGFSNIKDRDEFEVPQSLDANALKSPLLPLYEALTASPILFQPPQLAAPGRAPPSRESINRRK